MFRHLEDLRDKHKGEEIWILGRGPSLDDYPLDFFDDKTSIAINYAVLPFPNCTYYFSFHTGPAEWVRKNWPDRFDRCILGCHYSHQPGDKQRNKCEKSGEVPIYAEVRGGTGWNRSRFKRAVERNIAKESCMLINGITTLHTAIQTAITLGAKKIILAGCELRMRDGLFHAKKTWLNAAFEKGCLKRSKKWWFPRSEEGLTWLTEICKPHSIEIVRYYYGEGYEQIKSKES